MNCILTKAAMNTILQRWNRFYEVHYQRRNMGFSLKEDVMMAHTLISKIFGRFNYMQ